MAISIPGFLVLSFLTFKTCLFYILFLSSFLPEHRLARHKFVSVSHWLPCRGHTVSCFYMLLPEALQHLQTCCNIPVLPPLLHPYIHPSHDSVLPPVFAVSRFFLPVYVVIFLLVVFSFFYVWFCIVSLSPVSRQWFYPMVGDIMLFYHRVEPRTGCWRVSASVRASVHSPLP